MHIFMSYARGDVEVVQPLSVVLGALGIRTWLDTEGLPPGTPQWDQMIRTALRDAHALIAFCSENARESQYMAIELEIAKSYKKKIIPVWIIGRELVPKRPYFTGPIAAYRSKAARAKRRNHRINPRAQTTPRHRACFDCAVGR